MFKVIIFEAKPGKCKPEPRNTWKILEIPFVLTLDWIKLTSCFVILFFWCINVDIHIWGPIRRYNVAGSPQFYFDSHILR